MNQNDIYMALGVLVGMSMFAGVFLYKSVDHVLQLYHFFTTRNKFPRLQKFKQDTLCLVPHVWHNTKLLMMNIDPGVHKVCSNCGYVAGSNKQLNKAGIQAIRETIQLNKSLHDREERAISRVSEILQADREMWIKTNIGAFGRDRESNMLLLEKFSKFTVESLEAAGRRAIEEDKVQK